MQMLRQEYDFLCYFGQISVTSYIAESVPGAVRQSSTGVHTIAII